MNFEPQKLFVGLMSWKSTDFGWTSFCFGSLTR